MRIFSGFNHYRILSYVISKYVNYIEYYISSASKYIKYYTLEPYPLLTKSPNNI